MRTVAAVLMTVLVTACGVDLPLRDDIVYTCDDDADCPLELSCAVGIGECVQELDAVRPRLTSITATDPETVILVFDEPVSGERAKLPGVYFIVRDDGQPLDVEGAQAQDDGTSVVLRTGRQRGAAIYTFATTLTDRQGNEAQVDQDSFVGFGPAPDRVVPDAIAPTAGSIIVVPPAERADPVVTLAWSPRSGAIAYTLEISSTADFTTIDSRIVIPGDQARYALTVAEGMTYFWRVRSDATPLEEYGRSVFTVLFDTIYVYCPAGLTCRSSEGIGSKNVPLAAVSRAVNLANDRALSTIAIASRGRDPITGTHASYHEPVAITGDALTLRGGYDATFSTAPNRGLNPTRIAYEGSVVTAIQNRGSIAIDKLELEALLDPTVPARTQTLGAFVADSPGAEIVISDSFIGTVDLPVATPASELPDEVSAVVVFGGTQPLRIDAASTILAGPSVNRSNGLVAVDGQLDIDGAEIIARPTSNLDGSTPVLVGAASVSIRRARLRGAGNQGGAVSVVGGASGVVEDSTLFLEGPGTCIGALVSTTPGASFRLERNAIVIAPQCDNGIGLFLSGPEPMTVANNIIVVDSGTAGMGVHAAQDTLAQLIHNTITISSQLAFGFFVASGYPDLVNNLTVFTGPVSSTCIFETGDESDPKSVLNNVFVGCATPCVNELAGTPLARIDDVAGEPIACAGCGTTRASGNVLLPPGDPFVSRLGPDGMTGTLDFDLRLASADPTLAQAGRDTTVATCGSNESPHGCGSVITDIAGLPRTLPVSVGAYERD